MGENNTTDVKELKQQLAKIEAVAHKWITHYPGDADLAGKIESNLRDLNHLERAINNVLNASMCIEGASPLGLVQEAADVMKNQHELWTEYSHKFDRATVLIEALESLFGEERRKRKRGRRAIKHEIADCGYMNGKYFMVIEAHEPTYRALEQVKLAFELSKSRLSAELYCARCNRFWDYKEKAGDFKYIDNPSNPNWKEWVFCPPCQLEINKADKHIGGGT